MSDPRDTLQRSGKAQGSVAFSDIIEQKENDWSAFIHNRIVSPTVDPVIAQSWIRSNAAGIDPYHIDPPQLSDEALSALREKNAVLLQCALPLMRKLNEVGDNQIIMMSLHDKDGYMLELFNDDASWTDPRFRPGVRWQEQDVGTNGLGLVLIEKKPIQIIGQEHYSAGHHNIFCCAAPIFNSDNELVAVLNVTSRSENYSSHLMQLVVLICQAITNQLKDHTAFELDESVFRSISEGVLVLNSYRTIIRCNERAAEIFNSSPSAMLGYHIQDIINIPDFDQKLGQAGGKTVCFRECSSYFNDRCTICDVSATPVISDGAERGTVLIVRNSKFFSREIAVATGQYARYSFSDMISRAPKILAIVERLKAAADLDTPLLLMGEQGVRVEKYAHAVHSWSKRKDMPFCTVNCASMPAAVLSCELFGCEKGFYGGQVRDRSFGKLEIAEGGTIFLDSIESLGYEMQEQLVSVLRLHRLRREGGKTEAQLHVRVIAATQVNLSEAVAQHCFSEELFRLIGCTTCAIPPLREHPEDIPLIAADQLAQLNQKNNTSKAFSEEVLPALQKQRWPGNVRQLQETVVRAFYKTEGSCITPDAFPLVQDSAPAAAPDSAVHLNRVEIAEREALIAHLSSCDNDVLRTASELGISRATLYRRLKKYGIAPRSANHSRKSMPAKEASQ